MAEEIKSQVDNEAMTAAAVQAERARVTAVRDICAGEHNNIEAAAIADGSTPDQVRAKVLDAIRAKRMTPPAPPKSEISPGAVLAAAISQACGVSEQENIKANGETALAAADKAYRGNLGLQGTIIEAAKAHGWSPSGGNRLDASNWFEAVQAACSVHAGYSEVALPNILGGVINRRLLEGWGTVDQSWRQISDVATVNDFKAISSYRLIKGGGFQKVSETGELKHGSLSEAGFSNRADTYGEMLTLTRKDIINDDLNALARVPFLLGQEAALAFNVLFWTEFLNDAAFFSSGNGNLQSSTALSVDGLTSGVKKFRSLKDEAGHFLGSAPAVILVAPGNEVLAEQLFKDTAIVAVGIGSSKALSPASNPHAGKYKPVCSPYLADTSISGYSDTSWYLLSSPAFRAAIQAVFLGGRQTPYVQSAETAFNTLGIQYRAYMDWGVAKQDYRAGVKFTA